MLEDFTRPEAWDDDNDNAWTMSMRPLLGPTDRTAATG